MELNQDSSRRTTAQAALISAQKPVIREIILEKLVRQSKAKLGSALRNVDGVPCCTWADADGGPDWLPVCTPEGLPLHVARPTYDWSRLTKENFKGEFGCVPHLLCIWARRDLSSDGEIFELSLLPATWGRVKQYSNAVLRRAGYLAAMAGRAARSPSAGGGEKPPSPVKTKCKELWVLSGSHAECKDRVCKKARCSCCRRIAPSGLRVGPGIEVKAACECHLKAPSTAGKDSLPSVAALNRAAALATASAAAAVSATSPTTASTTATATDHRAAAAAAVARSHGGGPAPSFTKGPAPAPSPASAADVDAASGSAAAGISPAPSPASAADVVAASGSAAGTTASSPASAAAHVDAASGSAAGISTAPSPAPAAAHVDAASAASPAPATTATNPRAQRAAAAAAAAALRLAAPRAPPTVPSTQPRPAPAPAAPSTSPPAPAPAAPGAEKRSRTPDRVTPATPDCFRTTPPTRRSPPSHARRLGGGSPRASVRSQQRVVSVRSSRSGGSHRSRSVSTSSSSSSSSSSSASAADDGGEVAIGRVDGGYTDLPVDRPPVFPIGPRPNMPGIPEHYVNQPRMFKTPGRCRQNIRERLLPDGMSALDAMKDMIPDDDSVKEDERGTVSRELSAPQWADVSDDAMAVLTAADPTVADASQTGIKIEARLVYHLRSPFEGVSHVPNRRNCDAGDRDAEVHINLQVGGGDPTVRFTSNATDSDATVRVPTDDRRRIEDGMIAWNVIGGSRVWGHDPHATRMHGCLGGDASRHPLGVAAVELVLYISRPKPRAIPAHRSRISAVPFTDTSVRNEVFGSDASAAQLPCRCADHVRQRPCRPGATHTSVEFFLDPANRQLMRSRVWLQAELEVPVGHHTAPKATLLLVPGAPAAAAAGASASASAAPAFYPPRFPLCPKAEPGDLIVLCKAPWKDGRVTVWRRKLLEAAPRKRPKGPARVDKGRRLPGGDGGADLGLGGFGAGGGVGDGGLGLGLGLDLPGLGGFGGGGDAAGGGGGLTDRGSGGGGGGGWGAHAAAADARATAAEARVSTADARATAAETRVTAAEARATAAEARARDITRQLEDKEKDRVQAREDLAELKERALQMETRLSAAETRALQAETRESTADKRAKAAEERADDAMKQFWQKGKEQEAAVMQASELKGAMKECIAIIKAMQADKESMQKELSEERFRQERMLQAAAAERDTSVMRSQQVALQSQATAGTIAIALAGREQVPSSMAIAPQPIALACIASPPSATKPPPPPPQPAHQAPQVGGVVAPSSAMAAPTKGSVGGDTSSVTRSAATTLDGVLSRLELLAE